MWKRIGIVMIVIAGAGAAFVAYDRLIGAHRVDDWIARLVVGVANTYLVPQIDYESLTYTAPGTIDMQGVTFTAPDGTTVIDIASLSLTLAEVPSFGEPIVVEQVTISDGQLHLIQDADGGLVGLDPFVKPGPTDQYTVEGHDEPLRISDTLRLRNIRLEHIDLTYDDGSGPPLVLDDLSLESRIDSETLDGQQGWYALDLSVQRDEAVEISLPGHFNIDKLVARIDQGVINIQLDENTIRSLPSELQSLLAGYEAGGRLHATIDGYLPLADVTGAMLTTDLELEHFKVTSGDFTIPVDSLEVEAGLAEGTFGITKLQADMLGGSVEATAHIPVADSAEMAKASWTVSDVDLATLMSAQGREKPSKLEGILNTTGNATAAPESPVQTIEGAGELHVRKGRLVMLKLVNVLASAMNIAIPGRTEANQRADAEFKLTADGVKVVKLELVTGFLAAQGTGVVGYSGALDLKLNAGPLERIEAALGAIGDIFAKITDQVMTYHVRGTIGDPKIGVTGPAGIGAKRSAPNADDTPKTDTPDQPSGDATAGNPDPNRRDDD